MTSADDARLAVSLGVDALGFLIGLDYPTDDEVDPKEALAIISKLPPFVSSVLVTHRTDPVWIADVARTLACSAVQLHGNVPMQQFAAVKRKLPNVKVIKTIHVESRDALRLARQTRPFADAVLLDTRTDERIGGTGRTHDWSISAEIVRNLNAPVILAGGLNPENVQEAIALVTPFAVDVNSGVENPDGSKSAERVTRFISLSHRPSGK